MRIVEMILNCNLILNNDIFTGTENSRNETEMYKCDRCARIYKRRKALFAHQKYKCGVAPQFMCQFCSKRFTCKSSLRRHIDTLHRNTNLSTPTKKNIIAINVIKFILW